MYASLQNHIIHFGHYIFAYILAFVVVPKLIFGNHYGDALESIVSNYIKTVLFFIVSGYLLVLTKLFELIALFLLLVFIFFIRLLLKGHLPKIRRFFEKINTTIYDYADGILHPKSTFKKFLEIIKVKFRRIMSNWFNNLIGSMNLFLFISTVLYISYLHFYDTYFHAAPAMSDGYVTLAWMKYISGRVLFHDGIYPQGFHINLAVIQKFAAIDPLYVLKYTGPFNTLLICLGLCFVVCRVSGRIIPGILSASIYGVFFNYLSCDWQRQVATNSQEFAFVFIVPTIYFYYRYIKDGEKVDFFTAAAGIAAMGLIHTVAFAFAGLGLFAAGITALIINCRIYFKRVFTAFLSGAASVVIAVIPVGIGLLMGKSFHGSSAEFLTKQVNNIEFSTLKTLDFAALFSIGIIFLYSLFSRKKRKEVLFDKCIVVYGTLAFAIYYAGGALTKSIVLASRSGDVWAIISPLCIGTGISVLFRVIPFERFGKVLEAFLCAALLIVSLVYIKPQPIVPYKMERDSKVEQYLRIKSEFRPSTWMIVSQDEEYAIVLGESYHMLVRDFLSNYNPEYYKLGTDVNGTFEVLDTPDIFVYQEKNIFTTDFENLKFEYERREMEKAQIADWIDKYKRNHDNISLYYEDDDLEIYHIHQPLSKEEQFERIWNDKSPGTLGK